MKSFILFWTAAILFCPSLFCQDFEGHIAYKVTTHVDPKIQQASQELNTPENKEKMKMLEEQMKNPEFQKMLEKNPQLKVQIESALKVQAGGGLESFAPKSITIYLKEGNSLIKTEGGAQNSQLLYLKAKNTHYQIFPERKVYWNLQSNTSKDSSKQLKAIKTTETLQILGYTCTKYTVQDQGSTMAFWTTTQIKGMDYEQLIHQYQQGASQGIKGLEGITLKMEFKNAQGTMDMEAIELKRETLASSMFTIPAGFTEEKMSYAKPNSINK